MKRLLVSAAGVLAATILFLVGMGLGGALAGGLGVPAPALPEGVTQEQLMPWMMAAALLLAATLAPVAAALRGRFALRFLVLWTLLYAATFVNNVLEARIFMTTGAASGSGALFTLLVYLPPSLLMALPLTFLGRPDPVFAGRLQALVAGGAAPLAGRLFGTFAAFPLIYLVFGLAVLPFVERWYREGLLEMAQPGWAEIVPTLAVRSLVFLAVVLPVVLAWGGGRRRLLAALGPAMFVMVGGFHMVQAYWLPGILRGPHLLEILADSVAYVAVVGWLLMPGAAGDGEAAGAGDAVGAVGTGEG